MLAAISITAAACTDNSSSSDSSAAGATTSTTSGPLSERGIVKISMAEVGDPGNPSVGVIQTFGGPKGKFVDPPRGPESTKPATTHRPLRRRA